ncbi:tetratricopeptide repeat protein [Paraclostridium sordellii]|uniref:tetratricopeptide repeat protein n=1 Tax=Paraclostridium sordellii TaxID=1505 RepID=UPI0005E22636|nr:hypothetical protein [Paeniclostridium sordellii]CEQ28866.1 chaperone protein [[Clostridium] sordellii] [Paeniclostridium sordellii]
MYSNHVYNENMNLAKSFIERKDFKKAYDLLESVADKSSAKWFYLMGITSLNIGYYEQGEEYLKKAVSLSPDNKEYKDAFIRYNNNYNDYDRRARSYNRRRRNDLDGCCCCCCDDCCCCCGDDFCEVCTKLWCLDSICECFGGDFIECC